METHKEKVIERTLQTEHATLQPTPKELPSLAELYNYLNPEFRALRPSEAASQVRRELKS